jgi:hypothetical protein
MFHSKLQFNVTCAENVTYGTKADGRRTAWLTDLNHDNMNVNIQDGRGQCTGSANHLADTLADGFASEAHHRHQALMKDERQNIRSTFNSVRVTGLTRILAQILN